MDGRIENVTLPHQLGVGDTVTALAEDAGGRLWIGTMTSLSLWQDGAFLESAALANFERAGVRALLRDRGGGMWIATRGRGLFELGNRRLVESQGPPGNQGISAYCLLEDQAGNLWASVGNGTVLCRRPGGEWGQYTETNGLPFAYVTCLAQEADGTLWAGSLDDGLYCFLDGHFVPLRKEQGLSANDIRSLCPDREGNLWVGTRTGGLNRLSRRKVLSYSVAQGLTNDYTRSVAETADGTLWVATTGGGLYRGGVHGFERYAPTDLARYFAHPESLLAARDGSLWCGAARGLLRYKDGELGAVCTNEPWVRAAALTALCEDRQGGLWVGTSEGRLVHFQDGKFAEVPRRVARGAVLGLAQEAGWPSVGGLGGGGHQAYRTGRRFHLDGDQFAQPGRSHPLPGSRGLLVDRDRRRRAKPLA